MSEIGAKVWTLAMNSSVQGPTDENGCGEWLHSGEFVLESDYEIALKLILEKDAEIERLIAQYNDLVMCVANKYPGESRHKTAKKYIERAEYVREATGRAVDKRFKPQDTKSK